MKVLVTGAAGQIGQATTRTLLDAGHTVVGVDRSELPPSAKDLAFERFELVDLTDHEAVLAAVDACDAVVHIAAIPAPGIVSDFETHNNNVTSSYNVLRAAAEHNIGTVVQMSSINAIGAAWTPTNREFPHLPLDENKPPHICDPYALSKAICEQQATVICNAFPDTRIASFRPSLCFPAMPGSEKAKELGGGFAPLEVDKLGERTYINEAWSWTLTESLADAVLKALTSDRWSGHEVFFMVSPRSRPAVEGSTVKSQDLQERYHPKSKVREGWWDGEGGEGRGFIDCSKAERLLGWKHP